MRVIQITKPTGIDALKMNDVPQPKPGPRQVLVKVHACSLNFRDLAVVAGKYARGNARDGLVPLSDGAGEIAEIGTGVTKWKVGDRVASCFFQRWIGGAAMPETPASALGGGNMDGMLSEYVVLEEDGVVRIPNHLSFEEASTLPCAGVTAWNALVEHAHLTAGQTVLVQGTGGVSIFALQFSRLMGAAVIATSSSDEKLAKAKALGATHGINYKTTPEWDKAAIELTGIGVDQVVDVGGAGTFARSLGAIRPGGKISLIGVLTGPAEMNPQMILGKRANVQGISVGSLQMFEAMNRAITVGQLKPVIDKVFPFDDSIAAFKYLQSAAHFGKVVIKLD